MSTASTWALGRLAATFEQDGLDNTIVKGTRKVFLDALALLDNIITVRSFFRRSALEVHLTHNTGKKLRATCQISAFQRLLRV